MTVIRRYRAGDEDALYEVCLKTGAAGGDASDLYADPRLPAEIFVGPYLALEPTLAFVVEDAGVAGYVLGARDTAAFGRECERTWWPRLRARYPADASPSSGADARLLRLIHEPPGVSASIVARYPAHLHIDLLPRTQGRGLGRKLLETLFAALRDAGSTGVHLGVGTANERAVGFYRRMGFAVLAETSGALLMGRDLD